MAGLWEIPVTKFGLGKYIHRAITDLISEKN
jgi:hypothetical protein